MLCFSLFYSSKHMVIICQITVFHGSWWHVDLTSLWKIKGNALIVVCPYSSIVGLAFTCYVKQSMIGISIISNSINQADPGIRTMVSGILVSWAGLAIYQVFCLTPLVMVLFREEVFFAGTYIVWNVVCPYSEGGRWTPALQHSRAGIHLPC